MPKSTIIGFAVLELGFFGNHNLVLGNGKVCLVLVHRLYRANPAVITDHHIHRLKRHLLAFIQLYGIPIRQLAPKFRTGFLKIGLCYIEYPEDLHLRIYIVHLLLFIGELLKIVILDLLLGLLVDAGKGSEHHGEGFFALVH